MVSWLLKKGGFYNPPPHFIHIKNPDFGKEYCCSYPFHLAVSETDNLCRP